MHGLQCPSSTMCLAVSPATFAMKRCPQTVLRSLCILVKKHRKYINGSSTHRFKQPSAMLLTANYCPWIDPSGRDLPDVIGFLLACYYFSNNRQSWVKRFNRAAVGVCSYELVLNANSLVSSIRQPLVLIITVSNTVQQIKLTRRMLIRPALSYALFRDGMFIKVNNVCDMLNSNCSRSDIFRVSKEVYPPPG